MAKPGSRLVLPVPNLGLSKVWDVGPVRFHPAGTASGLVTAALDELAEPARLKVKELIREKAIEFDRSTMAEVTADGIDEAIPLVESALAALRVVQHVQNPMSYGRDQTFGLPGQVMSATVDYWDLTEGPGLGWRRRGALAGWNFGDASHDAWSTDPAFRFINEALLRAEADQTPLQRRTLVAIDLLSQAWLSWQPDVALLNSVMALEALLGEAEDGPKKFRLARRVSYFVCGWPGDPYAVSQRPACPLMTLPLTKGRPGSELQQLIKKVRKAGARGLYCTYFFDVMDIYDARNTLGHGERLGLSVSQAEQATWFIPSILLRPLFTWFAEHADAELSDLDSEIACLPPMTA